MAYTAPKCAEQIWSKSMGLASFSVCKYGKSKGSGAASIQSTEVVASGTLATNATAKNAQSGGSDITLRKDQIFQVYVATDTRISFGGTAATATTGHFIPGGTQREYECNNTGTISMIDA